MTPRSSICPGAPNPTIAGHASASRSAYSSLGTGSHLGHAAVARVAERVGRTPAQVLLRWCLQRGTLLIPKSTHRERIEENGALFDFELNADDMEALDALDRTGAADKAREQKWW